MTQINKPLFGLTQDARGIPQESAKNAGDAETLLTDIQLHSQDAESLLPQAG